MSNDGLSTFGSILNRLSNSSLYDSLLPEKLAIMPRTPTMVDLAVADPVDCLDAETVVAVAETGHIGESLLLGDFGRFDRDMIPVGVDAARFLRESVLPGLNPRFERASR